MVRRIPEYARVCRIDKMPGLSHGLNGNNGRPSDYKARDAKMTESNLSLADHNQPEALLPSPERLMAA
jgi:hypothetical protein